MDINIKLLNGDAKLPLRAKAGDAGADLFSTEESFLRPGERKLIKTGISIAVPNGYYARIAPRSGLAYKNGIDVLAGVIDSGYRAEVGVVLVNLGHENFFVKVGDRIAQLIIEACFDVTWQQVDDLDKTDRQEGGFGSTGTGVKESGWKS